MLMYYRKTVNGLKNVFLKKGPTRRYRTKSDPLVWTDPPYYRKRWRMYVSAL